MRVIRLDLPGSATEEEIETFLATLNERARYSEREMLLEGASEIEITEYLEGIDRLIAEEEASGFEEEESAPSG